jgi:hypothetical protein
MENKKIIAFELINENGLKFKINSIKNTNQQYVDPVSENNHNEEIWSLIIGTFPISLLVDYHNIIMTKFVFEKTDKTTISDLLHSFNYECTRDIKRDGEHKAILRIVL